MCLGTQIESVDVPGTASVRSTGWCSGGVCGACGGRGEGGGGPCKIPQGTLDDYFVKGCRAIWNDRSKNQTTSPCGAKFMQACAYACIRLYSIDLKSEHLWAIAPHSEEVRLSVPYL